MTNIIISHGMNFCVEGTGFVKYNGSADFERAVDAIQSALDDMPLETAAALHADTLAWIAVECDGDGPAGLSTLETIGHAAATADWVNPSAVFVSVSAHT